MPSLTLREIEIEEYARAVVFAFEFKEPIKTFHFKGLKEFNFFLYNVKKLNESPKLYQIIKGEKRKRNKIKKIINKIALAV